MRVAVLSRLFARDVRLARAAPENFTIDQYHPDQEHLDPQGHRDEVTETKLGRWTILASWSQGARSTSGGFG